MYSLGTFALAFHFEMVSDTKRVSGFQNAIRSVVQPGDVVLDIGTGSGILALIAAESAARVYGVELDHSLAAVAAENYRCSAHRDKLTLLVGDATDLNIPEDVDVILCEMMDTVLLNEPQVPVLRAVRRRLKAGGRVIPFACRTDAELVDCNFQPIPVVPPMRVPHYERIDLPSATALTTRAEVFTAYFMNDVPDDVSVTLTLRSLANGTANAIRLHSTALLADDISLDACPTLNCPIVVPLARPTAVTTGELVDVQISYRHFTDFRYFHAAIVDKV